MRVGVDEAGKGPVLGSMFAAAVRAPRDALPAGIADSKELAPERRESLAAALRDDDRIAIGVAEVPPERIDDPETDMNTLTVAAQAEALVAVDPRDCPVIVDAGDVSAERFARRVADQIDGDPDIAAEHGADATHPIVGAASIVAKVERDAHVATLAAEHGDVGSGYPSDPTTRTFLEEYVEVNGCLPDCARASWRTCDDVLERAEERDLGEF